MTKLVRGFKEKLKEEVHSSTTAVTTTFDLQKVFRKTSSFYYSRRLVTYNFMNTELDNVTAGCYFWYEAECLMSF